MGVLLPLHPPWEQGTSSCPPCQSLGWLWVQSGFPCASLAQLSLSLKQLDKEDGGGEEETPNILTLHFKLRKLFPWLSNQQDPQITGRWERAMPLLAQTEAFLFVSYLLTRFNRSCKDRMLPLSLDWVGKSGFNAASCWGLPEWPGKDISNVPSTQL